MNSNNPKEKLLSIEEVREEVKKRIGGDPYKPEEGLSKSLINHYVDIGLIAPPKRIAFHDGKRGVRNYFPEKIIDTLVKIKRMTKQGMRLEEIKKELQGEPYGEVDKETEKTIKLAEVDSIGLVKIIKAKPKAEAIEKLNEQIERYKEIRDRIM